VTTLSLITTSPTKLKVDALVIAVAKGDNGPVLLAGENDSAGEIDQALGGKLAETLAALGATGGADEVTKGPSGGKLAATVVAAVGVGPQRTDQSASRTAETLRRAAGAATRALAGCRKVAFVLPAPDAQTVGAIAEGGLLGAYTFHRYRKASREDHKPGVEEIQVSVANSRDKAVKAAASRAEAVAAAVALTRDLVNTPPADLHPETFADAALAAAKGLGLKTEVLDEKALAKGGYGGIIGVGQGSMHPPRLVKLTYKHSRAKRSVALVGKGITFDSGGLSLKPAQAMEWMKADMGGAAAVIAAMTAIAKLEPTVNVVGWAPMAENMPSGTAQRPSDVLTMYGGKTVEVLNTDAEGRLILADALARASEDKPDLVIDIATLTGAQMVALGSRTAAVMSNDDAVRTAVHDAADRAGEQMWPMPLPAELRKSMDSEVADIANMGEKYGGMLVAGLFLQEFVADGLRWAHLDIAGPSFNEGKPWGYTPKGGTGAGVRTLVQIVEDVAEGRI
jgi:leucyl aminopeptidase